MISRERIKHTRTHFYRKAFVYIYIDTPQGLMSGLCRGTYVILAWHILIARSRMFFSFIQNRRKLQVSCSTHNPHGCLPSPGCVCAVSTHDLKSKPAPASEKHPQKVTRSGLPCLNFQPGGALMPVSLMLCITLLSALPGGVWESLWLRVNFTVAILFFPSYVFLWLAIWL